MTIADRLRAACVLPLLLLASIASARQGERPMLLSPAKSTVAMQTITLAPIDAEALRAQRATTIDGALPGVIDKRLAITVNRRVAIDAALDGTWQVLADGTQVWHVGITSPGATDLHLGFQRYVLPAGARLWVIGAGGYYEGPYSSDDGDALWVPMVPGDSAMLELQLPPSARRGAVDLVLSDVGAGFRDLFKQVTATGPLTSGACNINVVCPLGQPYSNESRALAYYEFTADDGFGYICTGTMLNTTAGSTRPFVLTAAHCMSSPTEVTSMRVYWNYRSAQCTPTSSWSFAQNQTGATLRATRADVDTTLVELNAMPDAAWRVFHAGWDASGVAPATSIGLHHPKGDVAKVTESRSSPRTMNNCIGTGGSSVNTHWLSGPYTQGTTEGGSSGSGLWIPSSDGAGLGRRLIGVLSGGNAGCSVSNPSQPDNGYDCYGKLSAAWEGASAATRLRDWLDPASSGTRSMVGAEAATTATPAGLRERVAAERQAASLRAAQRGVGARPLPFDPRTRPD